MRSPMRSIRVGPKSNDRCFYKGREGEKTQSREGDVKAEAEIGRMHLCAMEHQGLPATPRRGREARNVFSPGSFKESYTCATSSFSIHLSMDT